MPFNQDEFENLLILVDDALELADCQLTSTSEGLRALVLALYLLGVR